MKFWYRKPTDWKLDRLCVQVIHWAFHQIEEASQDHSYTSRPEDGEMMFKQCRPITKEGLSKS